MGEVFIPVDTGAFGLILPRAWRDRLGPLPETALVQVETADQRVMTAEVSGPVRIQVDGFRRVAGEVAFMEMEPGPRGRYQPLLGYTVLALSGVAIDMVTHRLVRRAHFPAKPAAPIA